MYAKLQLPRSQGEVDPADTYDDIEQWPIKENITEDKEYDTIGTEGGQDVEGALYVNAAHWEAEELIPTYTTGKTGARANERARGGERKE